MTLADRLLDRKAEGWRPAAWAAEAVGTAVLVFDALSAVALTMAPAAPLRTWPLEVRLLVIGLVVGGTVAIFAVTPAGKRSGAHLNPAVSVFMALRGALSVRDALAYSVVQLVGSVVGVLVARLCWGGRMHDISDGLIQPGPGVGAVGVLVGETFSVVVLLLVLSWLVSKPRPRETPWVIGGLFAVLIAATGATSGGSFNPARDFGPFVLGSDFHFFWIYMLAPLGGAFITAALLRLTNAWSPRTCKLCGPAFDKQSHPAAVESPFRRKVCQELELAGFTIYGGGPAGGVEVRQCPAEYGGGLLISWAPHAAAFSPIDERVTAVEKTMVDALASVMSELGFTAERLGESFSVRVADAEPPSRAATSRAGTQAS
ncbi:aquaporin [Saccharopolyspora sp. K220]|uniref:MIP/aquaporin family protein n=1 Tax=Saccharopolyspora soli TaxID=2926618 RepID=UPI001F57CEF9|nr:aquaporin [Saccharopolyspora soli]MCI2423387.1 aquaporin [Saccharopolyspora soli]